MLRWSQYNDNNQLVLQGTGLSLTSLATTLIINQHNWDFCLDLTDGGLTNSNQLQIWTCSKGNKNQVWLERPPGNGSSTPPPPPKGRPLHRNGNSSKCVDVKGAIFTNGTPVQIFVCLPLGPLWTTVNTRSPGGFDAGRHGLSRRPMKTGHGPTRTSRRSVCYRQMTTWD